MASPDGASAPGDGGAADPVRVEWMDVDMPTVDLVEAVAAATDRDVLELPPLNDTVDGDALATLVRGDDGASVRLSFTYAGASVVVDCGEAIEVRPRVP